MTARSLAAMACAGMLAATPFPAQSQSSHLPDSSPGKSVVLNITVLDQRGDPVTDLTRDDFQIYDDGKPQPITSYVPGTAKPVAETPRPATVILFDLLNSNNQNRDYISTFIVRALEPLENADTVYLFLLTNRGEIYPVRGFAETPPTAYLPPTRSSAGVEAVGALPWTRQVHPLLNRAIQKVYGIRPMDDRDTGFRAATTFVGLTVLQQAFSRVPGPKTIVWITSGVTNWPQYPHGCKDFTIAEDSGSYVAGKCTSTCRGQTKCVDYEPFLQHFTAELSRSNTLLYSAEDLPTGALPPDDRGSATDTLRQLSDLTGGRMYTGTNVDKAISDAMKNARGRYQVTIAAPAANGKHHKLRVTCARKGVHVEAPRGYWSTES